MVGSLGVERPGQRGQATVDLTAPASAKSYPKIWLTREPNNGDPDPRREILVGSFCGSSELFASVGFGPTGNLYSSSTVDPVNPGEQRRT